MKKRKKVLLRILCLCIGIYLLIFCGIVIAHSIVFSRADYNEYASDYYLIYDDVSEE